MVRRTKLEFEVSLTFNFKIIQRCLIVCYSLTLGSRTLFQDNLVLPQLFGASKVSRNLFS